MAKSTQKIEAGRYEGKTLAELFEQESEDEIRRHVNWIARIGYRAAPELRKAGRMIREYMEGMEGMDERRAEDEDL